MLSMHTILVQVIEDCRPEKGEQEEVDGEWETENSHSCSPLTDKWHAIPVFSLYKTTSFPDMVLLSQSSQTKSSWL